MALNGMDHHSLDLSGQVSISDLDLSPIRLTGHPALAAVLMDAHDVTGDRHSAMSDAHELLMLQYEIEVDERMVEVAQRQAKIAAARLKVEKLKSLSGSQRSRTSLMVKPPIFDEDLPRGSQQLAPAVSQSWMSDGLARDLSALIGEDFLENQKREAAAF